MEANKCSCGQYNQNKWFNTNPFITRGPSIHWYPNNTQLSLRNISLTILFLNFAIDWWQIRMYFIFCVLYSWNTLLTEKTRSEYYITTRCLRVSFFLSILVCLKQYYKYKISLEMRIISIWVISQHCTTFSDFFQKCEICVHKLPSVFLMHGSLPLLKSHTWKNLIMRHISYSRRHIPYVGPPVFNILEITSQQVPIYHQVHSVFSPPLSWQAEENGPRKESINPGNRLWGPACL